MKLGQILLAPYQFEPAPSHLSKFPKLDIKIWNLKYHSAKNRSEI